MAILAQVAEALDHTHANGVIHRDVKPSNVLLDDKERAYVGDFGLAHMVEGSIVLTRTGMVAGTPQYMAPEQAESLKVDRRADIYALGIVAYEMLTGAVPFTGDTPIGVAMKHANEPLPIPPPERVPEALMRPVLKALAKDPADRWESAGAFSTALARALDEIVLPSRRAPALASDPDSEETELVMRHGVEATGRDEAGTGAGESTSHPAFVRRVAAVTAVLVAVVIGASGCATTPPAAGGVPEDEGESLRWYRLAANQGDASAQNLLGLFYDNGAGVPEDDTEAVRWYRLAADQGYARAQFNIGFSYANGEGVPEDDTEAVRWYRLAADQGYARAQVSLGVMYSTGRGVPQDFVEAHMWANLGALQLSGEDRDLAVRHRDDLAAQMTPDQIAEAQHRAREWTPTPEP